MTIISDTFEKLKRQDRCALIPFITAGDPDLETTAQVLRVLDNNGADLIEIGFPYSDPLADGPVIHAAATRALRKGTRLEEVLEVIQTVSSSIKAPLILFTYYNPILNRGIKQFVEQIARIGVEGLIVPDLPIEEASTLLQTASEVGVEVTLLVAPTSSPERIKAIANYSSGFIYLVSVTGVTGIRSNLHGRVEELLGKMRRVTNKPIGVGFGISNTEQAQQVREWGADAVIIGSAFVQRLATGTPTEGLQSVGQLCRDIKTVLDTPKLANVLK